MDIPRLRKLLRIYSKAEEHGLLLHTRSLRIVQTLPENTEAWSPGTSVHGWCLSYGAPCTYVTSRLPDYALEQHGDVARRMQRLDKRRYKLLGIRARVRKEIEKEIIDMRRAVFRIDGDLFIFEADASKHHFRLERVPLVDLDEAGR